MSKKGCFIILSIIFDVLYCLRDSDVNLFNVSNPLPYNSVCGINYDTNTVYTFSGTGGAPFYSAWNGIDSINAYNYSNISIEIDTNVIGTSISWFCWTINCGTQIGRDPYIYIVYPIIFSGFGGTMMIFDMNTNNYVPEERYKSTSPDFYGLGC